MAGFNKYGTLGGSSAGPVGLPYAIALARAGLTILPERIETVIHGSVVEGFVIGWSTGKVSNIPGTALRSIEGKWSPEGIWVGSSGPLEVTQSVVVTDSGVSFKVSLLNIGATTLENLRYLREVDFDTDDDAIVGGKPINRSTDAYPVNGKIVERNKVQCGLRGEGKNRSVTLGTDDSRAVATFIKLGTTINANPLAPELYEKAQIVGYTKTGDILANLVFAFGSLAPGATADFEFSYTVV